MSSAVLLTCYNPLVMIVLAYIHYDLVKNSSSVSDCILMCVYDISIPLTSALKTVLIISRSGLSTGPLPNRATAKHNKIFAYKCAVFMCLLGL